MKVRNTQAHRHPQSYAATLVLLALGLVHGAVQAQMVYRIEGPNGKVTFSDKAPVAPSAKASPTVKLMVPGQAEPSNLPLELRQASAKFPVTLYTSSACSPCDSGRSLLQSRGIPFTEKTVNTPADVDALQKLGDINSLPLLTIGGQHVSGYQPAEWNQYLSAAAYPEQSKLPVGYRRAPATALVAPERPVSNPAKAESNTAAPAAATPAPSNSPNPNNPAGIQF